MKKQWLQVTKYSSDGTSFSYWGMFSKAGARIRMFCLDVQLHEHKYWVINTMNKLEFNKYSISKLHYTT